MLLVLQLKKGDRAWILGHFGAPHTTEVMTVYMANWSSINAGAIQGLVSSSSVTDYLCDLGHIAEPVFVSISNLKTVITTLPPHPHRSIARC